MKHLTEAFVDASAPNAAAIKNGWGLVKSNKFIKLAKTSDDTLLFGECKGSGANPYLSSVDFMNPDQPTFRCTCPSRQFPCKHSLGLMYAYVGGKPFEIAEIPADITEKRAKAEKKEEKSKAAKTTDKKKTNKSALTKKIHTQLEGLELLGKLVSRLIQAGLGTIDRQTLHMVNDMSKQLGSRYLVGPQMRLKEFAQLFETDQTKEIPYKEALRKLIQLHTLSKKGMEYLQVKLESTDLEKTTDSALEEWLGHAWQLMELKELGLTQEEVQLIQLSFQSYTDQARGEFVDEGIWINTASGSLVKTLTFRPFKAAKYIKEDDSFFEKVHCKEMYHYPTVDMNPRVRWEESTLQPITTEDLEKIRKFAHTSYQEVFKLVKNQWKNILSDKNPCVLLAYSKISKFDETHVLVDQNGAILPLIDIFASSFESCHLLSLLKEELLENQVILVRFEHDWERGQIQAQPLSIVTESEIIRLLF